MPLHYAATKYALSVRTKHWALAAARSFSHFPSWESVFRGDVEDTAEELREHVTEMVRQDTHSLWSAPAGIPGPPHKESFQTTALQQRKLAVQVPVAGGTRMGPTRLHDAVIQIVPCCSPENRPRVRGTSSRGRMPGSAPNFAGRCGRVGPEPAAKAPPVG